MARWMRDEAHRRIGHLYPKVRLPKEHGGGEATRHRVDLGPNRPCPNPACGALMLLVRSFALSTKKGNEAWVEPIVDRVSEDCSVRGSHGQRDAARPPEGGSWGELPAVLCAATSLPMSTSRPKAVRRRMGSQLMAIVADGQGGASISSRPTSMRRRSFRSADVGAGGGAGERSACTLDGQLRPHPVPRSLHTAAARGPHDVQRARR